MSRTKVAILGGGMAGLATAFELSATQDRRDTYDVTIYQSGWRLGGKCASGRNAEVADRIEEHGLHLWFGSYDNAFSMTAACYRELDRATTRPNAPIKTIQDAVRPADAAVLYDSYGDRWSTFALAYPPNPHMPWDEGHTPSFVLMAGNAIRVMSHQFHQLSQQPEVPESVADDGHVINVPDPANDAEMSDSPRRALRLVGRMGSLYMQAHAAADIATATVFRAFGLHPPRRRPTEHTLLATILDQFRTWVFDRYVKARIDDDDVRHRFGHLDAVVTFIVGMIADDVLVEGFDHLDDEDLRVWMTRHGANEITLGGPFIRAWYDGAFAYLDGEPSKPDVAAGASLKAIIRQQLGYKGSVMWKLQAGMGDAVVAPLYEVLVRRGVKVELFTHVGALHLSPDGGTVESVDVHRQASTVGGAPYQPLVDVGGLPCWPTEPHYDQLVDGLSLRQRVRSGELDFAAATPIGVPGSLRLGVDFDEVVLAISVAALPAICSEVAAKHPPFAAMLAASRTCMTQAIQLWVRDPQSALGWPFGPAIMSTYVEPLDTYCDMTHLIAHEGWSPGEVGSIAYFCGVLPDRPADTQASTTRRVHDSAVEFLERDAAVIWPSARDGSGFAWGELVDRQGRSGAARLDAQYWRANHAPTERYVLTPSGSVSARLAADESGLTNLVLAGDWTRNGLDLGCVEAAVMSGRQAARAVLRETAESLPVPGEDWRSLGR